MSDVTVIIPCYNQEHWLSDAVESCLNQTVQCAIIVVDDGSPVPVTNKWENVTLIRQENKGLSGARNTGIRACKTKYFLTLDADDVIHKDFIKKTIGVDDIVGTWQQEFGDSNTLWKQTNMFPIYEDFLENNQINCCSLTEKKVFDTIGGYDENMRIGYEDWDFWTRATKAGFEVTVIQEPLFFYRKHGRSMVDDAWDKHEEIKLYMKQKYGLQ
jgi:glycosyltransferase involved in cell wall biosynthesis